MTAAPRYTFLGRDVSPITARRLANFRANKRGFWSLWIFLAMFLVSLFAEVVANDDPIMVWYQGDLYTPIFHDYPETAFGGFFPTKTDYSDPFVERRIAQNGFMIRALIPYDHRTVDWQLTDPAPTPPSAEHWLGTDDQARDVVARVIYGFRISVLFGLAMTALTTIIGVSAGAVQGYFGGWTDLIFQRVMEVFGTLPMLMVLIILASVVEPNFWWLLGVMVLFGWPWPVGYVRAEFLRARNFDFVKAAKALGVSDSMVMFRHILPNAMVATLTFLPFTLAGSITTLTALDFIGFGLPPGSASLGDLLAQGKANLQAPWLGLTGFFVLAVMLSLLFFIGEAVRDAFDPRKLFQNEPTPAEPGVGPASSVAASRAQGGGA
ncbi:ABC transporter permease [Rhodovibrio sodomensis]|uniref:ABC transporter permease n=1 Tax=Rhodovibrio sodomensis TaxID=1088 RepID=A0ABS1DBM5_9PROT|nr:ABC transporter permease [Rhodovibrio sodomensis]MBK1667858.1 ABC transporter permease [Rhodovibrio sodomensis]